MQLNKYNLNQDQKQNLANSIKGGTEADYHREINNLEKWECYYEDKFLWEEEKKISNLKTSEAVLRLRAKIAYLREIKPQLIK